MKTETVSVNTVEIHDQDVPECMTVLLAVADALVVKTLETVGKRITRGDRSRFKVLGSTPFHLAHTFWEIDDYEVARALRGAFDVVPILMERHTGGCAARPVHVEQVMREYVHDLVITGTPHSVEELAYRFRTRLPAPSSDEVPRLRPVDDRREENHA